MSGGPRLGTQGRIRASLTEMKDTLGADVMKDRLNDNEDDYEKEDGPFSQRMALEIGEKKGQSGFGFVGVET